MPTSDEMQQNFRLLPMAYRRPELPHFLLGRVMTSQGVALEVSDVAAAVSTAAKFIKPEVA